MSKAQLRQGILNKVSGTKWGLDIGVLRISYDAIIGSLLRFALVPVGSSIPGDLFWSMETNITNVAARKITGLPRSARVESLHFLAGIHSFRNLYIFHYAEFLDGILRCHNSTIRSRISEELKQIYTVETLVPIEKECMVPLKEVFRHCL